MPKDLGGAQSGMVVRAPGAFGPWRPWGPGGARGDGADRSGGLERLAQGTQLPGDPVPGRASGEIDRGLLHSLPSNGVRRGSCLRWLKSSVGNPGLKANHPPPVNNFPR